MPKSIPKWGAPGAALFGTDVGLLGATRTPIFADFLPQQDLILAYESTASRHDQAIPRSLLPNFKNSV